MGNFWIVSLFHSASEMKARKWWLWWWRWGGGFIYISTKLSEADTKVLKRTNQEIATTVRKVSAYQSSLELRVKWCLRVCVDVLGYVSKWLIIWEQWTAKSYHGVVVFPTDAKAKILLFTDKQALQEVKKKRGVAMQLKRAGSFTLRPRYSCWIHSCWSLYMRLGLLVAVSRTIMIVPGFEILDRNAAHPGLSRRSSGFDSSPAALGHFDTSVFHCHYHTTSTSYPYIHL